MGPPSDVEATSKRQDVQEGMAYHVTRYSTTLALIFVETFIDRAFKDYCRNKHECRRQLLLLDFDE